MGKKAAAQVAEVNVEINSRDKRTESRKAMMEVELETENEDPLGGLEADDVPNGMSGDEPAVVMENAEEDVDQPQAQQDNELSTPPREDHEDKNEVSPTGEALKKSGADLFDSLFFGYSKWQCRSYRCGKCACYRTTNRWGSYVGILKRRNRLFQKKHFVLENINF